MAATVVKTTEGTWRAVCRDEKCRSTIGQRMFWRSGHLNQAAAKRSATEHNRNAHTLNQAGFEAAR